MRKRSSRILAIILAICMFWGMMPVNNVLASEADPVQEQATEAVAMEEAAEPEQKPEREPVKEEVEVKEDSVEEETVNEITVEATEEPVEAAAEEVAEEVAEETAFLYENIVDQTGIKISAQAGVFPAGTTVNVKPVSLEEVQKKLGKEVVDAAIFDITFADAAGNEVQPNGKVDIEFSGLKLDAENAKEANVYRIQDDGKVDVLKEDVNPEAETVTFKNDHFTDVGIAVMAEDDYIYKGYKEANKFSPSAVINFHVENTQNPGETYVAYCYNMHLGRPDGTDNSMFRKGDTPTSAQEFESSLASDSPNKLSAQELQLRVMNVLSAGYPYNNAGLIDYARNDLKISEEKLNDALRIATQYALWHYTDGYYVKPQSSRAGQQERLIGAIVDYAEAQKTLPEGLDLTIFYPQDSLKQKLLTTNKPEGTDVTKKVVDVKVSKQWSNPAVNHTGVTVRLFADGVDTGKTVTLSADNNWSASFKDLEAGKAYTVKEDAVAGYTASISGNATTGFVIKNTENTHTITISKIAIGGEEISGAKIQILAEDQKTVKASWTSEANTSKEIKLAKGIYYFHEVTAPTGYVKVTDIKFEVDANGKVKVLEKDGNEVSASNSTLTVVDQYAEHEIEISKVNLGGQEIGGAAIEIYNANGDKVTDWTSVEGTNHKISLQPGSYTFHEKTAPTGYVKVTDITFDVAVDGTVTVTNAAKNVVEAENNKLTVTDLYEEHEVEISKIDVGGEELPGAKLSITDANGNQVDSWESGDTAFKISLQPGTYTLTEEAAPGGYEIAESIEFTVDVSGKVTVHGQDVGGTVTMTDDYKTTSYKVKKIWDDNNNQDGFRPTSLVVKLFDRGTDTGKTLTLTAPKWEGSFENLRTHDDNGDECVYSAQEVLTGTAGEKYTATSLDLETENGVKITNKHEVEKTEVSGKKIWNDNNDADKKRPESITVVLKKSTLAKADTVVESKTVTAANNWEYTFSNLPKYEDGRVIQYFVQEQVVPEGYSSTVEDYNITNTRSTDKVNIQVRKEWDDSNNRDGIRPQAVTVKLLENGVDTGKTAQLNEGNRWFYTFENLDKNRAGEEIKYTVEEEIVKGYMTTIEQDKQEPHHFTITNTHEASTVNIAGEKIWEDFNNQDGKRPESIIVTLYADGEPYLATRVTKANKWRYSFENLPEKKDGKVIVYTIDEDSTPEGYSKSINGYNITNSYTPGKTSISVLKNWEDHNNQDGLRPAEITVSLLADGVETGKTVKLNAGNAWTAVFEDLDLYKAGQLIKYTVEEGDFANKSEYQSSQTVSADKNTVTLINAHEPERISVKGTKTWEDQNNAAKERPTSITVLLQKKGQTIDRKEVTPDRDGTWTYSFDDLPKYEDGTEIRYSVLEEAAPKNYQSMATVNTNADGTTTYDLENRREKNKIAVQVTKSWEDDNNRDGIRPETVTVKLFADGVDTGKTVILSVGNNWSKNFEDLDEFKDDGSKIVYTVEEESVKGYKASVTSHQEGKQFTITNTHENEVRDITVTKKWEDDGDSDSDRPGFVTVVLYKTVEATKEPFGAMQLNKDNEWKHTFTNLPVYEKGNKVSYTVEEFESNEKYESAVDDTNPNNLIVTNTKIKNIIKISKRNIGGEEIPGAKLVLGTSRGFSVAEWTSDGTPHEVTVAPGEYVIYEDTAPDGYEIIETQIWFTVDDKGNVTVTRKGDEDVTVTDEGKQLVLVDQYKEHDVEFSKVDLGGKELAGAKITVSGKTSSGTDVEEQSWTSNGNAHKLSLPMGEYTMTETAAPEGYEIATEITFTVDEKGNVEVTSAGSGSAEDNIVTMVDGYALQKVKIAKTDLGGDEVVGAKITVSGTDKAGNEIQDISWESEVAPKEIELPAGNYTFHEELAPKGYKVVTDLTFEVGLDGKVTVTNAAGNSVKIRQDGTLEVADTYAEQKVKVSKIDIAGEEIEGAEITVNGADKAGNAISEIKWTSGKAPKEIELPAGTYTFVEKTAPTGYEVVNEVIFAVDLDGKVTVIDAKGNSARTNGSDTLIVTDRYLDQDVTISKTDITGAKEIEGAELTVKDLFGGEVGSWTSKEDESHKITVQPGIYVLTETTAPKGYKVAESIAFKVDHLGKITIMQLQTEDDGSVSYEETQENVDKVVMKDDYADGKVIISKTDVAGSEIPGAKLQITDKDGKVVKEWTSEAGKNKEVELYPGTYTLTEKTAPKGYEVAESITFKVDHLNHVTIDDKEVGKVTMVDEYAEHTVKFSKTDIKGKELKGATIVLTDQNGRVVEKWKTTGKVKEFSLKPGKYTFTETAAPKGYKIATEITFEVGVDGKITSKDVKLKGTDKNIIVMVDDYKTVSKNKSAIRKLVKKVRTGDTAQVFVWGLLLLAAMICMIIAGKKRREK